MGTEPGRDARRLLGQARPRRLRALSAIDDPDGDADDPNDSDDAHHPDHAHHPVHAHDPDDPHHPDDDNDWTGNRHRSHDADRARGADGSGDHNDPSSDGHGSGDDHGARLRWGRVLAGPLPDHRGGRGRDGLAHPDRVADESPRRACGGTSWC